MAVKHKKKFGVYLDALGRDALLIFESDSQDEAEEHVEKKYKGRISSIGADLVEIVDKGGTIVAKFNIR
jgi:hypothetical protein